MNFVRRELGEAAEASNPGAPAMRREVVVLALALLVLVAVVYASVGFVVELALPHLSVAREKAWFGAWKLATPAAKPGKDEAAWRRAQQVVKILAAQSGVPALDYRLHLLNDDAPNAFALPGGTIGVTRGLLRVCGDDEVALAFVLGHEFGHFAHRDHLRAFGQTAGRTVAWAILFGGDGDLLETRVNEVMELAHSRAQEAAADAFGLELVRAVYGRTGRRAVVPMARGKGNRARVGGVAAFASGDERAVGKTQTCEPRFRGCVLSQAAVQIHG